jgi:hypothetical protein
MPLHSPLVAPFSLLHDLDDEKVTLLSLNRTYADASECDLIRFQQSGRTSLGRVEPGCYRRFSISFVISGVILHGTGM